MTFFEAFGIVIGVLGLAAGTIGYVRATAATRTAERALAQSTAALSGSVAAADEAARGSSRAGEARELAGTAQRNAERALTQSADALTRATDAGKTAAIAAQRSREVASAVPDPGEVRWECHQVKGPTWVARNVGTAMAHSALLTDATRPPKYIRPDEVIPRDVGPGDHLQFRASSDAAVRSPRIRVAWTEDGDDSARTQELTLIIS